MPISSGASGRRPPSRPPPPAAARSTPNLTQQQQQQQQPVGRMIDAPPKVEARRQLGSQTLYGSKPPWATDDDAPQPPFYPPGGDLQHGEVTRMRRIKAARQIYKSPQSRDRHTTGSVDDLLRDCAISDHSHSPSPVRRAPSASSELQASDSSRPNTRSISIGTDTMDNYRSEPDLTRRGRHRRGRKNYDDDDDDESVSDDSLDGGGGRSGGRARSSSRGRGRHRARTESRGTSPPPQPPPPFRARPMPDFSRPLYVSTGGDGQPSPHSNQQQQRANGYGRTKMPAGLKPASERRYVPPPPPQQPPAPPIPKHDSSSCLPGDSPPFKARRMPDFSGGANPAPLRHPRSRSQSPAAAKGARQRPAAAAATPIATTTAVNNSSATSGYSSSPQRQRRERRRSMDEDSLTDVGSVREAASVSTEVLRPQRTAKADTRMAAADAVDSALRNLERQQLPIAPSAFPISDVEAEFVLQQERLMMESGLRGPSQLSSCSSEDSYWQNFSAVSDLNRSLLDANQSESDLWEEVMSNYPYRQPIRTQHANGSSRTQQTANLSTVHGLKLAPSSCLVCNKKVYPLERLALDDRVYHQSCFRCYKCTKQLSLASFAIYDGHPYCLAHDPSEQVKSTAALGQQLPILPGVNGVNGQSIDAVHEIRGIELKPATSHTAPALQMTNSSSQNNKKTIVIQRQVEPQQQEEIINSRKSMLSMKPVQIVPARESQKADNYDKKDATLTETAQALRYENGNHNHVDAKKLSEVKQSAALQRSHDAPPIAPFIHAPLAPADSPAVRRSIQPVARESDVNDIRPERGTARSLLDVWREREAASRRPQGWGAARTRQNVVDESELPPEGAARSALRLWRDMEAEATRSSGRQQFKAAS